MWSTPICFILAILQMNSVSSIKPGRAMSRCEKRRFDSFRQASTYTPRCNADGSFAMTQCSYESKLERVKCWEVDELGNPTGVTHKPIIYLRRQQNQRQKLTTLQPITNDASRPYFSHTLSEPNPSTTIMRQPTTTRPLSKCERMRKRRLEKSRGRLTSVIPTCTKDGYFKREQCNVGKTKCWCVGRKGKKIPGTRVRGPKRPNCYPGIVRHKNGEPKTEPLGLDPTPQQKKVRLNQDSESWSHKQIDKDIQYK